MYLQSSPAPSLRQYHREIGTLYQTWRSCCNKNQPGYPVPLMASHVSYRYCTAGGMSANVKSRRPKASTTPLTSSDRCCNRIRKTVYPSSQSLLYRFQYTDTLIGAACQIGIQTVCDCPASRVKTGLSFCTPDLNLRHIVLHYLL